MISSAFCRSHAPLYRSLPLSFRKPNGLIYSSCLLHACPHACSQQSFSERPQSFRVQNYRVPVRAARTRSRSIFRVYCSHSWKMLREWRASASLPKSINIAVRKAIHGLGYTTASLQQRHRYSYNLDAAFSIRDERPSCQFDIHGVRIIPRFLLFGPTISSRRKLRHESPRERLFARRSRNSRRFSAFVVQHS